MNRRDFICSAGSILLAAPALPADPVCPPATKPIGWAKWSADGEWFPVQEWYRSAWFNRHSIPYAVVACYADAA